MTPVMAWPYCSMVMCDMGVDVIKIEAHHGDSTRRILGAVGSLSFNVVNIGKRDLMVNLKQET